MRARPAETRALTVAIGIVVAAIPASIPRIATSEIPFMNFDKDKPFVAGIFHGEG